MRGTSHSDRREADFSERLDVSQNDELAHATRNHESWDVRDHVIEMLARLGNTPEVIADLIFSSAPHSAEVIAVLHETVGNRSVSKASDLLEARAAATSGTTAQPVAALRSPSSVAGLSAPATAPNDAASRWPSGSALHKARGLSDLELQRELAEVRESLGARSAPYQTRDASYDSLRSAQDELEFEARRRTDVIGGAQVSLDPLSRPGSLTMADERAMRVGSSPAARAAALRRLDATIAAVGLDGAERELLKLEQARTAELQTAGPGAGDGAHATAEPMTWLRAELEARRQEAPAFLERFEEVGRSIALGVLGESASRLQAELERYGLRQGTASRDGSLRGMGSTTGGPNEAMADLIAQGQEVRAAYDRARQHPEAGRAGWEAFEQTKAKAIAKHPAIAGFLGGTSALARTAPTGLIASGAELGAVSPELWEGMLGWELNQKLADNRLAASLLEGGRLSVFGVPRVVELTKLQMRVGEGMMLSGVVDERVRNPPGAPWTEHLSTALTMALGLLLAVPTGGTSVGLATFGNLALLASDLYLIGKAAGEREGPTAAANTDVTLEQSLIDEAPAAAPLVHQLLGGLGLTTGALGVFQSAANWQRISAARHAVAETKALQRTLAEHGADAVRAEVQTRVADLREAAARAGMPEERIEAMIRVSLSRGASGHYAQVGAGLDHSATVTLESAETLAARLRVPRVVQTGAPGRKVSLRMSQSGPLTIEQIEVAADATVHDVMMHQVTIDAVNRYRGMLGKVRELKDRIAELVRGEAKAASHARNPHAPRTRSYELFEEVRKHEAAVQRQFSSLLSNLGEGTEASQRAAWALEDEIGVLEGELAYYRSALEEAEATGNMDAALGVIEAPGDATRAAIARGYESPPDGYHYHRNRYKPDEHVISRNAGRDDLPPLQVNREGDHLTLGPADEARRQRIFNASMESDEVLEAMVEGSPSWRLYQEALLDPSKVGLPAEKVRERALRAIKETRTPRTRWSRGNAEVNEDLIRRALKDEFRGDMLSAALSKPTKEEQVVFLRKLTEDFGFVNASDKGNLFEELLAAQDPSLLRHAVLDRAKLAAMDPPVHISKDRVIDLLDRRGTIIEVKAVKTTMGKEQELQLIDYLDTLDKGVAPSTSQGSQLQRVVYAFLEPEGAIANRAFIQSAASRGVTIRLYNKAGRVRDFHSRNSVGEMMQFAMSFI